MPVLGGFLLRIKPPLAVYENTGCQWVTSASGRSLSPLARASY